MRALVIDGDRGGTRLQPPRRGAGYLLSLEGLMPKDQMNAASAHGSGFAS